MRVLVAFLAVVLAVAAGAFVVQTFFAPRPAEPPVPILGRVPDFALTRSNGEPLAASDLRDRVWVAAFVFTRCRGQCPVLIGGLRALQEELGDHPRFRLVSVTVDPEHDTPAVLAAFAAEAGADPERWWFVTGARDTVYRLAREGFLLGVEPAADPEGRDRLEPVLHSPRLVLVDPAGRVRGYYDGMSPADRARLARDARRLLDAAAG